MRKGLQAGYSQPLIPGIKIYAHAKDLFCLYPKIQNRAITNCGDFIIGGDIVAFVESHVIEPEPAAIMCSFEHCKILKMLDKKKQERNSSSFQAMIPP